MKKPYSFYCDAELLPYVGTIEAIVQTQYPEYKLNFQSIVLCKSTENFWQNENTVDLASFFTDSNDIFHLMVLGYGDYVKTEYDISIQVAYTNRFKILNNMS